MVKQGWVVDTNGVLHPVGDYAHLPPPERPLLLCPGCSGEMVLKLGPKNAWHAAHKADVCALGESALHSNAKFHLAHILRQAVLKRAIVLCGNRFCDSRRYDDQTGEVRASRNAIVCEDWDDIVVEYALKNQRRPDVAVLKDGKPLYAFEVFATHVVDADKSAALAALGVPWIEIAAKPLLDWTEGAPLPWGPQGRSSDPLLCDVCRAEEVREAKAAAVRALKAADLERNHDQLRSVRQVNFYDRKREEVRTFRFAIYRRIEDGEPAQIRVIVLGPHDATRDRMGWHWAPGPIWKDWWSSPWSSRDLAGRALNERVREEIATQRTMGRYAWEGPTDRFARYEDSGWVAVEASVWAKLEHGAFPCTLQYGGIDLPALTDPKLRRSRKTENWYDHAAWMEKLARKEAVRVVVKEERLSSTDLPPEPTTAWTGPHSSRVRGCISLIRFDRGEVKSILSAYEVEDDIDNDCGPFFGGLDREDLDPLIFDVLDLEDLVDTSYSDRS